MQLQENKSLKDLTTLGIGGPARYYIEVKSISELQEALRYCHEKRLRHFILGKGSNCLFDDRGFNGCIIHNKIHFSNSLGQGHYHVSAGYSFALLGAQTAKEGFSGLEFASGIPASVGGAIFMNAGANGQETKDALYSVDYVTATGELKTFLKEDLIFTYRYSSFQDFDGAIAGATFALTPAKEARSKQLELIGYRQKTQPYGEHSAGCIFRNPDGDFAGKLIEECGLKGFAIGEAEVSKLHANFLINKDSASSKDFTALIEHIRRTIREKKGIELESEVRVVPYDLPC